MRDLRVLFFAATTLFILSFSTESVHAWKSGETLNVYVVPHSHNDPGWWNTFETYYTEWTRGIITSVIDVLAEDKDRTFIWAEISFFQRWWQEQDANKRDLVRKLVDNKQLEFVTAGWVMNDEAGCHMVDIINQLTEGHEWLYNNVGTIPTVGWSIDPFGHSSAMPYILQSMGFKAMVINRIHRDKKAELRNSKRLEFHWQSENNETGPNYDILTHVFPWKLYDIPNTCGPSWDICEKFDFERPVAIPITSKNLKERSETLLDQYRKKAENFQHNHVLIPLGDDFKYKTADMTRKIMSEYKKMFDHINGDKSLKTNIRFSTLSSYFEAVQEWEDSKVAAPLTTYKGDFFTYCDEDQDYWSGYFTTRPFMKGFTRTTQSVLRTGESLYALERAIVGGGEKGDDKTRAGWMKEIEDSRSNLGIFQHHDGVTGTARVKVVQDYARRLHDSLWGVANAATEMAQSLLRKKSASASAKKTTFVWSYTQSSPMMTPAPRVLAATGTHVVVVHNSVQHVRKEVVSLYISSSDVKVTDAKGNELEVQVDPVWGDDGHVAVDRFIIHFVGDVPALGFSTFFVSTGESSSSRVKRGTVTVYEGSDSKSGADLMKGWTHTKEPLSKVSDAKLRNNKYTVRFGDDGLISTITRGDKSVKINQEFSSYKTFRSGAYLFLPNGPADGQQKPDGVRVVQGPVVNTAFVTMGWAVKSFTVRLYECGKADSKDCSVSDMVEILHTLDLKQGNTEVITRFSTDLDNKNIFYTDSNGLDMRKREFISENPIQSNYYPITSAAYLEDKSSRFTILSHEAHGAGSLSTGSLEVMLDRRLNQDDGRGLGESVTDNVQTAIPLWLLIEDAPSNQGLLTNVAQDVWQNRNYPLQQMYSSDPVDQSDYKSNYDLALSPLRKIVPENTQLLTFAPRGSHSDEILLRFYTPPTTKSTSSSKSVVDLDLFKHFKPTDSKDMSLSMIYEADTPPTSSLVYTLRPAEIKTFVFRSQSQDPSKFGSDEQMQQHPHDAEREGEGETETVTETEDDGERRDDGVAHRDDGDDHRDVGDKDEQRKPVNPPLKKPPPAKDLPTQEHKVDINNEVGKPNRDKGGDMARPPDKVQVHDVEGNDPDAHHQPPPKGGGQRTDEEDNIVAKPGKSKPKNPTPKKDNRDRAPAKSSTLYATSMLLYVAMAVCLFVGGYACRQRSKKMGFFGWNNSGSATDKEASVMKLL